MMYLELNKEQATYELFKGQIQKVMYVWGI